MNSLSGSGYEFVYVDVIIVRGFPAAAFVRMRKRNLSSFYARGEEEGGLRICFLLLNSMCYFTCKYFTVMFTVLFVLFRYRLDGDGCLQVLRGTLA